MDVGLFRDLVHIVSGTRLTIKISGEKGYITVTLKLNCNFYPGERQRDRETSNTTLSWSGHMPTWYSTRNDVVIGRE